MKSQQKRLIFLVCAVLSIIAPFLAPSYQSQMAVLCLMVLLALTWDIMGGQMGYTSFGNIVYFGVGMYVTAVIQRDLFFTVEEYANIEGAVKANLTSLQYLGGLGLGLLVALVICVILAIILGAGILGLRGQYFGICTLGLGIAAGEIASGIDYLGAGSGIVTPLFPDELGNKNTFYYYYLLIITVLAFVTLKALYASKFGLIINAIRDNEDKAEAMGIHTTRYKSIAWAVAALFLGLAGGGYGNLIGFIDPIDVAFPGITLGVWMILMAMLGGKGSLWGPVIGAFVFHITQELFWTYILAWQRVALGSLIILIVVFFPLGIIGWARERWPERFGLKIDTAEIEA